LRPNGSGRRRDVRRVDVDLALEGAKAVVGPGSGPIGRSGRASTPPSRRMAGPSELHSSRAGTSLTVEIPGHSAVRLVPRRRCRAGVVVVRRSASRREKRTGAVFRSIQVELDSVVQGRPCDARHRRSRRRRACTGAPVGRRGHFCFQQAARAVGRDGRDSGDSVLYAGGGSWRIRRRRGGSRSLPPAPVEPVVVVAEPRGADSRRTSTNAGPSEEKKTVAEIARGLDVSR